MDSEACTTIIVGSKMSADGSMMYTRSDDSSSYKATKLMYYPETDHGPEEFVAIDSPFRCKLPPKRLGFSALERAELPYHWGEAGFNSLGVGMSATETIFSSAEVLKHDPYVESGIGENCVFQITIPYVKTAREGVERLGALIEEHGSAEGFGIAFMDSKEIWYLENAGGHRYLACKIPDDVYYVSGNQSRYRVFDPNDKENFIASKDLIPWAMEKGIHAPTNSPFDFHESYSLESQKDKTYNYPRVWYLQKFFTPSVETDVNSNKFPIFQKADKPISVDDMRIAMRSHYDGTEHDPYLHENPKEPYRPVSIFRTINTHILQIRPNLPIEIGCLDYMAMGFADLSIYLPLYQGVKSYPPQYSEGLKHSTQGSAYWTFRKVMTLGMLDYNKYAPIIKKAYKELEDENDKKQVEMEAEFLRLHKESPEKATQMLQEWSDAVLNKALHRAEELIEELFTLVTADVEIKYKFAGA